jgi:hypothetical protein
MSTDTGPINWEKLEINVGQKLPQIGSSYEGYSIHRNGQVQHWCNDHVELMQRKGKIHGFQKKQPMFTIHVACETVVGIEYSGNFYDKIVFIY